MTRIPIALRSTLPALLVVLLAGWQDPSFANDPARDVAYSGRATVLRAHVKLLTSTTRVLLADTGEINPDGGTRDATVVTFDNPPPLEVHSKTAHAIAAGADNVSAATAAVQKLVIRTRGLVVTADVIEANSFAECHRESGTVTASGNSTILNLRVNGIVVPVSTRPNVRRNILGITVITNEQTRPDVNSVVVNAVHIIVPGIAGVVGAEVVIAHTESGIVTCDKFPV